MSKKILAFIILGTMLLHGCGNVTKERYRRDLEQIAKNEPIKLTMLEKLPDPEKRYEQFTRKLLQNELFQESVYKLAIREDRAGSMFSILMKGDWVRKSFIRGVRDLPLEDKDYLFSILIKSLETMPVSECANANKENFTLLLGTSIPIPASDTDRFLGILKRSLLSGLLAADGESDTAWKRGLAVAAATMFSKARETASDDELGKILYPIFEQKSSTVAELCESNKRMFGIITKLEPKYRATLIENFVK